MFALGQDRPIDPKDCMSALHPVVSKATAIGRVAKRQEETSGSFRPRQATR